MKLHHKHKNPATDQDNSLSFQEIYDSISKQPDFTKSELRFLHSIIQRKLRDGTLYVDKEDLILKPYRHLF